MENLKILSWNIRGFKSSKNMSNLKSLILKWNPTIVCIQETMMSAIEDKDLENLWPQKKSKQFISLLWDTQEEYYAVGILFWLK